MLHLPTLLTALLLGFGMLTLQLSVAQPQLRERPELRLWLMGNWAILAGLLLLAARATVGEPVAIVAGNGLLLLGLAVYAHAMQRLLHDRPAPRWVFGSLPLAWLALVAMVGWPTYLRTAVVSLACVALLWPSAEAAWRQRGQAGRSMRTVLATLGLAIVALVARAAHALHSPDDYASLLQPNLTQGLTFAVAFLGLLGAGFGFVLSVCERINAQLAEQASRDGLTGCYNRAEIDLLLAHALRRTRRLPSPVAFVLLDLDRFKRVNDEHGHPVGDAVLRSFAATVSARLRASDAIGRTGGEEFGLVLPDTDATGARVLVEAIRCAVEAMEVAGSGGQPLHVTVSAGIAVATPGDGEISADRLYGRADQSLYEAKRAGRNRVEVYGVNHAQGSLLPDA